MEKKTPKKRFLKAILPPLVLFILWLSLIATYLINAEQSPSVLPYSHSKKNFSISKGELLKNQIIAGDIQAKENFLGIISIRFAQTKAPISDKVIFRIKEKGSRRWYYINIYDARQFYHLPLYPFGFPIIKNSKGKTYEFEIQSIRGTYSNSVRLSEEEPILFSKYKYPKYLLLTSPSESFDFITNKSMNAVLDYKFVLAASFFLSPLIFYFCWHRYLKLYLRSHPAVKVYLNKLNFSKRPLLNLVYAIILFDVFFLEDIYDYLILVTMIVWVWISISLKCKTAFLISLIALCLTILLSIFQMDIYAEKSAIWSYLFLIIGLVQQAISSFQNRKLTAIKLK